MFGFGKAKNERKSWTLSDPGPEMLALFSGGMVETHAGEPVGPESAMRTPAVSCAVRAIAETMASLPLKIYKLSGSDKTVDLEHPANAVLARPVPWMSGYEFRLRLILDAIKYGRGAAVTVRANGIVRELHRVPYGSLRIERPDLLGEPTFHLAQATAGDREYGYADVVDIVPLPGELEVPQSILMLARQAIGFAATLERHGAQLFKNGARPGAVLQNKGRVTEGAAERMRKSLHRLFGGDKTGSTAILEEGTEWKVIALTSTDAQYLEHRRMQVLEIGRALRVPAHMMLEMDKATHANSEELGLQFKEYCLRPWADLIEGALERVLLSPDEQGVYCIEHDFDDLVRANMLARLDALNKAVSGGIYVPNEARACEGLPPKPGGDDLRVPLNTVIPGTPRDVTSPSDNAPPEKVPVDPKLRAVA